jgi:hypothetical protein
MSFLLMNDPLVDRAGQAEPSRDPYLLIPGTRLGDHEIDGPMPLVDLPRIHEIMATHTKSPFLAAGAVGVPSEAHVSTTLSAFANNRRWRKLASSLPRPPSSLHMVFRASYRTGLPHMRRRQRLAAIALIALGVFASSGCSLLVDFGRYATGASDGDGAADASDAEVGPGGHCGAHSDFALAALNQPQTANLDFPDASRAPIFSLAGKCPQKLNGTLSVPVRAFVAQNLTDASAILSTWVVCSKSSASYLALYAGSQLPSSELELMACATSVAGGGAEVGGLDSPESNLSGLCPGLTKANHGGLALAPCEAAVVYVEDRTASYYGEAGVSPTMVRVELEAP